MNHVKDSIIVPRKCNCVSHEELNHNDDLNKAKFKQLQLIILLTTIMLIVGLSVALTCSYTSMVGKETKAGFSCVYQPIWTGRLNEAIVITYNKILDTRNIPDHANVNLTASGKFTPYVGGTYSITFSYKSSSEHEGSVALVTNNRTVLELSSDQAGGEGRSLYLALNATDTVQLQCKDCGQLNNIHFCVALIHL